MLGLDGVKQIKTRSRATRPTHVGSIATLKVFGAGSGLTPSNKTLSFVQNHDTERNGDALSYKDGATNMLANEFLLAYGYGTPQVYSGFAVDQRRRLAAGHRRRPDHRHRLRRPAGSASTATRASQAMVALAQLRGRRHAGELVGRRRAT